MEHDLEVMVRHPVIRSHLGSWFFIALGAAFIFQPFWLAYFVYLSEALTEAYSAVSAAVISTGITSHYGSADFAQHIQIAGFLVVFIFSLSIIYSVFVLRYEITSEGIFKRVGILRRWSSVRQIDYDNVVTTHVVRGFWGGLLRYGTVKVSTAGEDGVDFRLQGVCDPEHVQQVILSNRSAAERRKAHDKARYLAHHIQSAQSGD